MVLLMMLFAKPIFLLLGGKDYLPYLYTMYGMGLLYLLISFGYPIRIAIRVMEFNRSFFVAYVLSAVFSMIAASWLIHQLNLYGTLVALILNQLIMLGYWQYILIKEKVQLWKSFTLF